MGKHALKEILYSFRTAPGKHVGKKYDEDPGYIKSSVQREAEKTLTRKVENDRIYEHDRDADTN